MLKNLFTYKFLFEVNRVMLEKWDRVFLIVGVTAAVIAVLFKLSQFLSPNPTDKKYRGQFFSLFAFLAVWELVWYASRLQEIKFFGTHFVGIAGVIIAFVWFVKVIVKMIRSYKTEKITWEKEQVRARYLPN